MKLSRASLTRGVPNSLSMQEELVIRSLHSSYSRRNEVIETSTSWANEDLGGGQERHRGHSSSKPRQNYGIFPQDFGLTHFELLTANEQAPNEH